MNLDSFLAFNLFFVTFLDPRKANSFEEIHLEDTNTFSWAGILMVNDSHLEKIAVTGIVLIHKRTALGNADAVSKIDKQNIRESTTAIFHLNDNTRWECHVWDYIIHPEYRHRTINTLALIKLHIERHTPTILHKMIGLPVQSSIEKSIKIYNIGFMDRQKNDFQQIIIPMEHYDLWKCKRFYQSQGMDFKYVWPIAYSCYKDLSLTKECVYDAGMILASNATGRWILLGISTLGPGCSLPSRFIEIYPYTQWILKNLQQTRRTENIPADKDLRATAENTRLKLDEVQDSVRSLEKLTEDNENHSKLRQATIKKALRYQTYGKTYIPQATYDDKDTLLLKYATNESLILYRDQAGEIETIYTSQDKECRKDQFTVMIYRESGWFKVHRRMGLVFFSISLYDLKVDHITCIKSLIKCTSKSRTEVEFHSGFSQEDTDLFLKHVPVKSQRYDTEQPYIHYLRDSYWHKRNYDVTTIHFRFYFYELAEIEIMFYGMSKDSPRPKPTRYPTTTTKTTKRRITWHWRRSYTKHYRWNTPPWHGGHFIGITRYAWKRR